MFQSHPQYDSEKINCFPSDITCPEPPLTDHIPPGSVDLITLIYVLSALSPETMALAIQNIKQVNTTSGVCSASLGLNDILHSHEGWPPNL